MKKQFNQVSLRLSTLDNAAFYQLLSETREAVQVFTKTTKQESVYTRKLAELDLLLPQFQEHLHQTRASQAIKAMSLADQERDDAFVTLTSLIRSHARVRDAASKQAYEQLSALLKSYTGVTSLTYEKESEAITHFLSMLQAETYQAAISNLHLAPHIQALTKAQKAFDKAYKERLAEHKTKAITNTKALRQNLVDVYDMIADFTAIYAAAYPSLVAYQKLHDTLNAIRRRFKAQSGSRKKASDESAEEVVAP